MSEFISHFPLSLQMTDSMQQHPQPLLLTPFILDGRIEEARNLAMVKPFLENVTSYSGYITVDEDHQSYMFFWFSPKSTDWVTAALVVWLQGGFGDSIMYAVFAQNGPYIYKDDRVDHSQYSWTNYFNVLYIENPIGTGFSFVQFKNGYSTDQTEVGVNLHETLRQFLILFPELQKNQLILSGQCYAGKYLTSLANTISQRQSSTVPRIDVFGIFLGNPMISIEYMLPHYNEYLYSLGFLDSKTRRTLEQREEEILSLILEKNWSNASDLFSKTFAIPSNSEHTSLLQQLNSLPLRNHLNFSEDTFERPRYEKFLEESETKLALHVGNHVHDANRLEVRNAILPDLTKSYKSNFERLLEDYRVLVYSGQLDLVCAYCLNEKLFTRLSWSGAKAYRESNVYQFTCGESSVGHFKQGHNFTHVLLRNAGHLATSDQPRRVLGLLKKFVGGTFDECIESLDVQF